MIAIPLANALELVMALGGARFVNIAAPAVIPAIRSTCLTIGAEAKLTARRRVIRVDVTSVRHIEVWALGAAAGDVVGILII